MLLTSRASGGALVMDRPRLYTDVHQVIDERAIWTAFQPIVRLDTREVVGYEALSRGPAGTPWQQPTMMFAAARAVGRAGELDWICRMSAYRAALEAGLGPETTLFVNVEPVALREPCPPDVADVQDRAKGRLRVVTELTERHLADDPAALLAAVAGCRDAAWGVALDDVGADPASLALMPFVHPDFVKLDMRLLHEPDRPSTAQVVNAVIAHAERTGAAILAEGIEREAHLARARAMGATLGQGWLFGAPGPLPRAAGPAGRPLDLLTVADQGPAGLTPFQIVSRHRPTTRATKRMLLETTRYLESKAADPVEPPVLLACFQDAVRFTGGIGRRYAELATTSPFVAAFGAGLGAAPAAGVRGADVPTGDPLHREWNVIVVGPHFSAALVARDLGDTGAQGHRRFDYALTYDRALVVAAARSLLGRLGPVRSEG
jgi:EAL domain-containing protein (putative c-di-GMP-specific phosphodiesterase class I)